MEEGMCCKGEEERREGEGREGEGAGEGLRLEEDPEGKLVTL